MKKYFFVFLLFSFACMGQSEESLISSITKETNKEKKVALQFELVNYYSNQAKFEESIGLAKKILSFNQRKSSEKASYLIAKSYIALAEIDSAQKYVTQSINLSQQNKSTETLANCYFVQSQIFQYKADFTQQANYSLKSIELAKKIGSNELLELNYRNMAMLYLDQHNNNKALEFSKKSLRYATLLKDVKRMSMANGAIGETYSMMYIDDKAEYYFKKSFEQSEKVNFKIGSAWTLTNWANIKSGEDALKMREEAQKIWNELSPDNIMSINNLSQISLLYYQKAIAVNSSKSEKEFLLNKAKNYLIEAIEKSKKSDNTTTYIEAEKVLAQIYYAQKDYKNAYLIQNEYQTLSDSLYSQENKNKIAALESKQKLMEKDNEIAVKKLTIQQNQRQKWFLIAGLALLAVIGLLLFYQSQNRKKTNQLLLNLNQDLEQANKTKARFFSILNHDLRAPVANLIDFLHLQKDSPDLLDETTKNRIQQTTLSSAENLLTSMEDLLLWSKSQMENFKPQPQKFEIAQLFEDTQKHFSSVEKIQFQFENPHNLAIVTDENYLKTIVRNLTGNAIKALDGIENPAINWKALEENGKIILSITDNGKGASNQEFKALYDDKEVVGIKTGLGLHLIRDLAKAINCEISVDSKIGKGTTFTLKFAK